MANIIDNLASANYLKAQPSSSDAIEASEKLKKSNELGKDAFLQLLMTQMQYQDPLEPVDNSQMLAQLAQFSALEQMQNVALSTNKQYANSMVGKYIQYQYTDPSTKKTTTTYGLVDYAKITGDTPKIGVNGIDIELGDVIKVIDDNYLTTDTTAYSMIGKNVYATVNETDAAGNTMIIAITGKVQSITFEDGKTYANIGNGTSTKKVLFTDIQSTVDSDIVGKVATGTYIDQDGNKQTVTGTIDYMYVNTKDNVTYLSINGQNIKFDNVTEIAK